jgi:hypothetical protein
MSLPPQFLDDLRSRVSLAAVIGRRVRLVRKGREHMGLCPFHNEKTPSFSVVEDRRRPATPRRSANVRLQSGARVARRAPLRSECP